MGKALVIMGADFEDNRLDQIDFDVIHAETISVSPSTITCDSIGQTYTLTATVIPSDAEDPIAWASSDENVATVTNGVVTIVGVGSCTISATAGSASASCVVSVSVYLTGHNQYKRTKIEAALSDNRITTGETVLGTSSTDYARYLTCCMSEMPYNNLMCYYKFTKLVNGTYELITDSSDLSGGELRFWNQIGYPVPIILPANTKKVRFISPDGLHGAYPMFFKHDVAAYPAGGTTEGRGHFSPWRNYIEPIENYSFTFSTSNDVNVPDGYDSIIFVWKADINNSGKLFTAMTDEEIAQFKVLCM